MVYRERNFLRNDKMAENHNGTDFVKLKENKNRNTNIKIYKSCKKEQLELRQRISSL